METKYCNIIGSVGQIKQFTDDIPCTIDHLVESSMVTLELFPNNFFITFQLYEKIVDIQKIHKLKYGYDVDYDMFISLNNLTVYVAIEKFNAKMLSHEIGHAIVESYFNKKIPYILHELMAQYCARNLKLC